MDETDLILSKLLLFNSRTPYRALAETLGLSVNAVHKRIQSLVEERVIRGFTTRVSLSSLGAFHIFIHGRSEAESTYSILEGLGGHESVYWVTLAGGNYVYVGAHLREIQELPALVELVGETGRMPDATVGIIHEDFSGKARPLDDLLQPLDWKIIRSLSHNSRKATSSIAEEVSASTRTVRRRLKRLIDENLVEFSIEWYPSASNDINTVVHLEPGSASAEGVIGRFMSGYQPNALFAWRFSNIPDQIVALLWSPSMNKLRELTERMAGDKTFSSTTPIILYAGNLYETWRDRLVTEKASPPRSGV
ncbi:MAG: AsnC family transcriptional regulator [Candidatus Bathyarchaeota archaeon]|nr:MAG: AsnC family transcriptional regulator [Candidatus Bathyarchaeota archaeon]